MVKLLLVGTQILVKYSPVVFWNWIKDFNLVHNVLWLEYEPESKFFNMKLSVPKFNIEASSQFLLSVRNWNISVTLNLLNFNLPPNEILKTTGCPKKILFRNKAEFLL